MEKTCLQIHFAAFLQPVQNDIREPAAKYITHTFQCDLRCSFKPNLDAKAKKEKFEALLKMSLRRKITGAKMKKKTHFVRDFFQKTIGNSSTSTTSYPIYIPGTIPQLQNTMEFFPPRMHGKHLKPYLQCGTDRP